MPPLNPLMNGKTSMKTRLLCALLLSATPSVATANEFMDTRISFTVSDDNILQGPTTTNPSSPTFPTFIGQRNNVQFYDNYDTRFTGFETMTNLAIFKKMPSFFKNIDTEAGLVLNAILRDDSTVQLGDAGSFLRIVMPIGDNKERSNLNFVAFPVNSDRFRGGYSFAISWGGNPVFPGTGPTPAFKVTLVQPNWYLYAGAKTSLRQRQQIDGTLEVDAVGGGLFGAGVDITDTLTFEVNGGFFDRGNNLKQQVQLQKLLGYGATAQIAYHRGLPIGTSVDFQLYRNDPDAPLKFFLPEIYDEGLSILVKAEFTVLGQNLQDISRPQSTKNQTAMAGDINFSAKYGRTRFFLDAVYRSLAFITYNTPGYPSYTDYPPNSEANPEFFVSGGFDYFIASAHLTPGIKLGVQRPAHFRGLPDAGNNPSQTLAGPATIIIRDANLTPDVLDGGLAVEPVLAATFSAKWDLSEIMSLAGQVLLRYDTNRTKYVQDPNGVNTRELLPPWGVGFNLLLQSRF